MQLEEVDRLFLGNCHNFRLSASFWGGGGGFVPQALLQEFIIYIKSDNLLFVYMHRVRQIPVQEQLRMKNTGEKTYIIRRSVSVSRSNVL